MGDVLLTETEARELIGCARCKIAEWIDEGRLWAINIGSEGVERPCWRISKASALALQQVCRVSAPRKKRKKEPRSCMAKAVDVAKRYGMNLETMSAEDWMQFDGIGVAKAVLLIRRVKSG